MQRVQKLGKCLTDFSLADGPGFPLPWEVQVAVLRRTEGTGNSNGCSFVRRQVSHDPGQGSPWLL